MGSAAFNGKMDDVEDVELDVLKEPGAYLRWTWKHAPEEVQDVLRELAHGEKPEIRGARRRWLRYHRLIDQEERLAVPVFGRWIREEEL